MNKKLIVAVLAIALVAALLPGCGSETVNPEVTTTAPEQTTEETQETTVLPEETLDVEIPTEETLVGEDDVTIDLGGPGYEEPEVEEPEVEEPEEVEPTTEINPDDLIGGGPNDLPVG